MVKLAWCLLLPFAVNGGSHEAPHCIGGSFQLTVDDGVEASAWENSMKSAVAAMAGDGIDPAHVDVAVSYGGDAVAGSCEDRYAAIALAAAESAASNATATPAPSPSPVAPSPSGTPTPTPPQSPSPSPSPSGTPTPTPPQAPSPSPGNVPAPAPGNMTNTPAPAPAPMASSGPSAGPSAGPGGRLLSELMDFELDRRLAEATANVAYTVVAPPDVISAASTALGSIDDAALTAAVSAAVEADDTLTSLPGYAAPTVVEGSMMTPTEPLEQPAAPSPSPPGEGDDSAAFSASLPLLGVACAAGSLLV